MFFPEHVIYKVPLALGTIIVNIFLIVAFFTAAIMVSMVIIYISQLHATLEFTNSEHIKLLNGMHEGVLIFNDTQDQFVFCNRQAKKILSVFFGFGHDSLESVRCTQNFHRLVISDKLGSKSEETANLEARNENSEILFDINLSDEKMSLEQIIATQLDEPDQKHCIFKLSNAQMVEKYFQIRVKSLQFLQKQSIAVYMYDVTDHINSLQLGNGLFNKRQREMKTIGMKKIKLHQELKTPLGSVLMMLQAIFKDQLSEEQRSIIMTVISQINFIVILVNDIIDLKRIECGDL